VVGVGALGHAGMRIQPQPADSSSCWFDNPGNSSLQLHTLQAHDLQPRAARPRKAAYLLPACGTAATMCRVTAAITPGSSSTTFTLRSKSHLWMGETAGQQTRPSGHEKQ
jgi:hypothetical protein